MMSECGGSGFFFSPCSLLGRRQIFILHFIFFTEEGANKAGQRGLKEVNFKPTLVYRVTGFLLSQEDMLNLNRLGSPS